MLAPGVGFEPTTNWLHLSTNFLMGWTISSSAHLTDARRFGPSCDGPTPFRDSLWTFLYK